MNVYDLPRKNYLGCLGLDMGNSCLNLAWATRSTGWLLILIYSTYSFYVSYSNFLQDKYCFFIINNYIYATPTNLYKHEWK